VDTYLTIASKRDWRRYADRPLPPDVQERILDAGRLAGSAMNRQPWSFVVVESDEARGRVADAVYAGENIRSAGLVVAIATRAEVGYAPFDAGRAAQNMMLAAWSEGVVSCPNGASDADAARSALGIGADEQMAVALSFGYPTRDLRPEEREAAEWSAEANRNPLDQVVRRI
jgi:nitroreductase